MKKILLISVAALFAWAASAQDNTYRNTQTNNYRNVKCTPNIGRISICLDGMSSVLYRAHVV